MSSKYLITNKKKRDYERMTGRKWDSGRQTGRSIAIALNTIAKAINFPGSPIRVYDHFGTREADRHLMRVIQQMVAVLNLKAIEFNHVQMTLTFNLYEPECTRCNCSACEEGP